jgi:hypothetical protein
MSNNIVSIKNVELQLHHFSEENIDIFLSSLQNLNDDIKRIIIFSIFINIYHFIFNPLKNTINFNIQKGSIPLSNNYSNLYKRTYNILSYLYNKVNIFDDININLYCSLISNLYNDNTYMINIDNVNYTHIKLLYHHFSKDFEYYYLINKVYTNNLNVFMMSFMPIIKILSIYSNKENLENGLFSFLYDSQINKLRQIFDESYILQLKSELTNNLNMFKYSNLSVNLNFEKILNKNINDYNIPNFTIQKMSVLSDYIILSRFKDIYSKNNNLSIYDSKFINKVNQNLDMLTPTKFPIIFSYKEKRSFFNFILLLIRNTNINENINLLTNEKINYIRTNTLFNNKYDNILYPYIFRYGTIEQYSFQLRNIIAFYFMLNGLLCLKNELLNNNNIFLIRILTEYIRNVKLYITDLNEISTILNI